MSLHHQPEGCRSGKAIDFGAVCVCKQMIEKVPIPLVLGHVIVLSRYWHSVIPFVLPVCPRAI